MDKTPTNADPDDGSEFLLYQTEDGQTRIQVRTLDETVWLTQLQMAELFQTSRSNINIHLRNLYDEGELQPGPTIKEYLTVQQEGRRRVERKIAYYNLDVIISVGYRVRSHRGTQFRQWATKQIRELIIKGFVLDDERLKEGRSLGRDYFDELLERIRDIRASEKRFYQKICDIYATSVDYDKDHPLTLEFFKTVQNKLHWAIHGHTAAEIIAERADGTKPNMGLTTWKNAPKGKIRKADTEVAKNYLSEEEISNLNLIVDQYLSFAELQARQRKPMTMADWKTKLDAFLTLNDRNILTNAGSISADDAKEIAAREYEKYEAQRRRLEANTPNDFDKFVEQVKQLPPAKEEQA
jgi:hypothetical protein